MGREEEETYAIHLDHRLAVPAPQGHGEEDDVVAAIQKSGDHGLPQAKPAAVPMMVDGQPVKDADGNFIKDKFAAVAVMEKRSNWDTSFDANQRAGDWGFAIYKTDGTVKDNKLDCASCHNPLTDSDFLFSHSSLVEFIK